ncbi:MAG: DUF5320 domain-containing protein [Bacteroidetes bacterium]|nr:DUF5320 domain-containing protein [Bacteroidota bacterium]
MPKGNGTGPMGKGPKTGRGLGFCTGNDMAGFQYSPPGFGRRLGTNRGRRWGRGSGFGFGRFRGETHPQVSTETLLENEARILRDQLASVEKQLSELKKKD